MTLIDTRTDDSSSSYAPPRPRPAVPASAIEPALLRLGGYAPLDPSAIAALRRLDRVFDARAGDALCADPGQAAVIVSGWAGWVRELAGGRRQIVRLLGPGDTLGLGEGPSPSAFDKAGRTVALSRMKLLDAGSVGLAIAAGEPAARNLAMALRTGRAAAERQLFDQIVRLGRQTASERLCHLFLELRDRMRAAGLGDSRRFPLPLTQEALADVTGLSAVHLNRTLQQLRRDQMLDLRYGMVRLLRVEAVEALANGDGAA